MCTVPHIFFTLFNGVLIVCLFNDMSTFVGHFVSSPREREKRDRRHEREGYGRKENEGQ